MILLLAFLLDYSQWLCLLKLFAFAYSPISSRLKVKNYLKINILIIKIIK